VFGYAATAMLVDPEPFARYLPAPIARLPGAAVMLRAFAIFELLVVAGLLSDRFVRLAALASAATVTGIVALNLDAFDVLFRNVAIATAGLALALDHPARPSRPDTTGAPT